MKSAIEGPNCLDKSVCKGDCCSIKIDIPKVLAEKLIEMGLASRDNFERGEIYSFNIKLNEDSTRCVFYDENLNGCSLHQSGFKPPQCWIYPTGFFPNKTDCIHYKNWRIVDTKATSEASEILGQFDSFSKEEFQIEFSKKNVDSRLSKLKETIISSEFKPKQITGFVDGWDSFSLYSEDNFNISISTICREQHCQKEFGTCGEICLALKEKLISLAQTMIPKIIENRGPQSVYPLSDLLR